MVLSNNLLVLYVGWELVGICSYLLIGFWYERRSAAEAAKKAFITTRIGDVGLLVGILLLYNKLGTFHIPTILEAVEAGELSSGIMTLSAILIFLGAMGEVGAVPAPRLAPRRHGRPDSRERPDPRGYYGRGRGLPRGEDAAPVRGCAGCSERTRHCHRAHHGGDGGHNGPVVDGLEARVGLLDG